jgi:hypothetical protein
MALILFLLCTILAKPWDSFPEGACTVKRSNHPINTVEWFMELHNALEICCSWKSQSKTPSCRCFSLPCQIPCNTLPWHTVETSGGANTIEFYSVRFIRKSLVNGKMEVWIKEWRTCLTCLTTVHSSLFGLSLVNALNKG